MKFEEMKRNLEDIVDSKIEEEIDDLFENAERFVSKVENVIWSLLESEDFTYRLRSTMVGNPNLYAQIMDLIKFMIQNAARQDPETDFSLILNNTRPKTKIRYLFRITTTRKRISTNSTNKKHKNEIPTDSDLGQPCKLRQGIGHVSSQCPEVPESIWNTLLEARKDNYNCNGNLIQRRNYINYSNWNSNTNRSNENRSCSASPPRYYTQRTSRSNLFDNRSYAPSSQQ